MKRKISSLALLVLVASMIVGSIPNYVYATSQSDSLIRIATQARDQIKIQLDKIEDISDDLQSKFDEGSAQVDFLILVVEQDDDATARQHFLFAMKIFNEISRKMSEQPTPEATLSARPASNITNEIDRLERYIDRLKEIATKNNVSYDFSEIDELIISARNAISEGNSDAAYTKTEKIKQASIQVNQALKDKTKQSTTDRAKTFAEKHLVELDKLITQAQEIGVSQTTLDRLIQARQNLDNASNVGHIIQQVKHIISVTEQYEDTKVQRIKSRINHLEDNLDQLSKTSDTSEYEKAKTMLEELKRLVSDNKLEDAIRMLHSLNNLINDIEKTSRSEDKKASRDVKLEQTKSLADSKEERIKSKIQNLETELNQLAEKVENPAGKRWLESAFSLIEDAKSQLDDNPDEALKNINKVQQLLKRIHNTIR